MSDKILFLDRDGVINKFPGMGNYVTSWKDFRFLPGSKKAVALLTQKGYEIHVVSNQGCVARKLITAEGLDRMTSKMLKLIRAEGGEIKKVFYCVHRASDHCACKKPKTKLFKRALRGRKVDLRSIFFVGDSREDMEAGKALGCKTILVLSGRVKKKDIAALPAQPDFVKKNLWEAARWITRKRS